MASLSAGELEPVLRLIRSENVGPVTYFTLLRRFGSASAALEAIPSLAAGGGRKRPITLFPADAAKREIEQAHKLGARFIAFGRPDYPAALKTLPDAPPLLTVLGNVSALHNTRAIAMVGARNASAAGCQFSRTLAQAAGRAGYAVISGLARGIDTAAHTGALATGTAAVTACGIDQPYPPENAPLQEAILAQGGAIVTEQPFGAVPHARAFPARNRIISGLAQATIIVEAALKSGSLITAQCALEQGREVFAVPGSPLDPRCRGTNHLLRQGAHVCESFEDIANVLNAPLQLPLAEPDAPPYLPPPAEAEKTEMRDAVLSRLGFTPVHVDELGHQCQCPPGLLSYILLELELAGRLRRHPGNKLSLREAETLSA